jgi:arylsulfatase A-like enzyme
MKRVYHGFNTEIITISVWFAFLSGIVEGLMFLIFQQFGRIMAVSPEIIWVSPLVNMLLFGVLAIGLVLIARLFPRLPIARISIFLFTLLSVMDWLIIAFMERLEPYAIVVFSIGLSVVVFRWYQKREVKFQIFLRQTLPWLAMLVLVLLVVIQGGTWLIERIALGSAEITSQIAVSPPNGFFLLIYHTLGWFCLPIALVLSKLPFEKKKRTQTANIVSRRDFLATMGFTLGGLVVGASGLDKLVDKTNLASLQISSKRTPNVILIVVDTLRADHLSIYGYPRTTSPNIDRLASHGILFENAIAPSVNSLPSHASIFSGLYPHSHGTEWNKPLAYRNGSFPTLAGVLRSNGYVTAGFSANLFWVTSAYGFNRGFIHFEDYFRSVDDMFLRTLYGRLIQKYVLQHLGFEDIPARRHAADINRSVFNWFDSLQKEPYFLFINYIDVHDPYLPPEPYRREFSKSVNPGGILNCSVGRCDPDLTTTQLQTEEEAYDGGISYVDDQINQLLDGFQKKGLLDNTLVIITSDHGEAFDEHGMYLHDNCLYREVIHVPLILIWPGQLPENVQVARPVTIAALPATVMDLLGEKNQKEFSIQSLRPLWEDGEAAFNWPYPLSEIAGRPWMPKNYPVHNGWVKSLVSPQLQFIKNEKLPDELYNWNADILEKKNLAQQPEMQGVIRDFHSKLNEDLAIVR